MIYEIKHRWSGAVIFSGDATSIKGALLKTKALGLGLYGADLRSANLYGAHLYGAHLSGADLSGADLYGAHLYGAHLSGADLRSAKGSELAIAQTRILPEGDLIGWKKCANSVIVKLLIPKEARRSHAFGRKCRAEFADVLEIDGQKTATSSHDISFKYAVGKRVTPTTTWCEDYTQECASGIHFFITRIESENY